MSRTDKERDDALDSHAERLERLEGRMASYADAELAYRQACRTIDEQRSLHESDHARQREELRQQNSAMLNQARAILEPATRLAVERATMQFAAPLAVVDSISRRQEEELRDKAAARRIYTRAARLAGVAASVAGGVEVVVRILVEVLR